MSQILENVSLAGKTSDLNLRETLKMNHPKKLEFPITDSWGYSIKTYYWYHQLNAYDMQWAIMAQYYFDISTFY